MNTKEIKSEFQFVGNSICSLDLHNDFISIPDGDLSKEFDVRYDIESINEDETDIWGTINLYVDCVIKPNDETDTDELPEFNLKLVLNGCFKDVKGISKEDFVKLLSINGCAALYSVARSIIMSISAQSVVNGSIVLPMINVFKLNEKSIEK